MSDENDQVKRLCVRKLPNGISEGEVKDFFVKICNGGPDAVNEVTLINKPPKGTETDSYTFGFVVFQSAEDLQEVLLNRSKLAIRGKRLDVRSAIPRGRDEAPGVDTRTNKVFLKGVPADGKKGEVARTIKEELEALYDTRYGTVEDVFVNTFKDGPKAGQLKDFAFITLSSEDFADRIAIGRPKIHLLGRDMTVSKVQDRDRLDQDKGSDRFTSHNFDQPSGMNGFSDRGGPPARMISPPRGAPVRMISPPRLGPRQLMDMIPSKPIDDRKMEERRAYEMELRQWANERRDRDEEKILDCLAEWDKKHNVNTRDNVDPDMPPPPRSPRDSGSDRYGLRGGDDRFDSRDGGYGASSERLPSMSSEARGDMRRDRGGDHRDDFRSNSRGSRDSRDDRRDSFRGRGGGSRGRGDYRGGDRSRGRRGRY